MLVLTRKKGEQLVLIDTRKEEPRVIGTISVMQGQGQIKLGLDLPRWVAAFRVGEDQPITDEVVQRLWAAQRGHSGDV